jgi:hypothetical protein
MTEKDKYIPHPQIFPFPNHGEFASSPPQPPETPETNYMNHFIHISKLI